MAIQRLASGLTVGTYQIAPSTFDIDKASDGERASYGFPRLTKAPDLQKRLEEKSKSYRMIEPKFRPRATRRIRLPRLSTDSASRPDHTPETTGTWAGGITFPPAGETMTWIEGTWTMPNAGPPPDAPDGQYVASTWVGIDGDDGSSDVLQAGCDADVGLAQGAVTRQFQPWWEWYPAGSFWITNLPVSAGDVLNCIVRLEAGSTTAASIFLGNTTTNVGLTFSVTAPQGTAISGNCAEWIVEALSSGPLASYGTVDFSDCNSGSSGGRTIPADAGNTINMVDSNDQPISSATIAGPTEVQIAYVPEPLVS